MTPLNEVRSGKKDDFFQRIFDLLTATDNAPFFLNRSYELDGVVFKADGNELTSSTVCLTAQSSLILASFVSSPQTVSCEVPNKSNWFQSSSARRLQRASCLSDVRNGANNGVQKLLTDVWHGELMATAKVNGQELTELVLVLYVSRPNYWLLHCQLYSGKIMFPLARVPLRKKSFQPCFFL